MLVFARIFAVASILAVMLNIIFEVINTVLSGPEWKLLCGCDFSREHNQLLLIALNVRS